MATKVRRLAASIMGAGGRDEWMMAITCVLFDLSRGVIRCGHAGNDVKSRFPGRRDAKTMVTYCRPFLPA